MAGRAVVIHDITPLVHAGLAVWPGDVSYERTESLALANGDSIDLSAIRCTVHLGAHVDAPSHYKQGGVGIDARPLERYIGLCQVIRVSVGRGERVLPEHVDVAIEAPRVLFHTSTFPDPDAFNEDFAALSPELVNELHEAGVTLVGIDTPSIDLCHDKALLTHTAVAERDMAILEGIVLDGVPPGRYTLVALPLKLKGADASPVRAILLEET
jgi:arylformamidase